MSTIEPHPRLSFRAKFDIAGLVTAGLASTIFFLAPLWISVASRNDAPVAHTTVPGVIAAPPALEASAAPPVTPVVAQEPRPAPTRRPAARSVRAAKMPEATPVRSDVKGAQSRVARLLLGDGSQPVLPFPLANQRSER